MRLLTLAAALLCLALGAASLLLAADVGRVEQRLAADDARFEATPLGAGYWTPEERLPRRLARRVLGVEDDLEHRRAVQAFWRSGPRLPVEERELYVAERARAQQLLTAAEPRAPTPERRAQIATLRGVLALVGTSEDGNRRKLAQAAADNFSRAVQRDPTYEDAKFNLEVMLKHADQTTGSGEGSGGSGGRKGTKVGGAAASGAGAGY
jgi:hypothetical protein